MTYLLWKKTLGQSAIWKHCTYKLLFWLSVRTRWIMNTQIFFPMVLLKSSLNCFRVCTWETLYAICVWELELPRIVQFSGQWDQSSMNFHLSLSSHNLGKYLHVSFSSKAKNVYHLAPVFWRLLKAVRFSLLLKNYRIEYKTHVSNTQIKTPVLFCPICFVFFILNTWIKKKLSENILCTPTQLYSSFYLPRSTYVHKFQFLYLTIYLQTLYHIWGKTFLIAHLVIVIPF